MTTICPDLWEQLIILSNGDVFCCCEFLPGKIGNIYNQELKTICNSKIIQEFRKMSLAGKLRCYKQCRNFDKSLFGRYEVSEIIPYERIRTLHIVFNQKCNLQCVMCDQSYLHGELDVDILMRNVDVTPFKMIALLGGEPLLIDEAKQYYDYLVNCGKRPCFITNGTSINDEWTRKIIQCSDEIHISLNAATQHTHELINRGSNWGEVLNNIQKLRLVKQELGSLIKIVGRFLVRPENLAEVDQFIQNYPKLGFDVIRFNYDKATIPRYLQWHPFTKKIVKRKILSALRQADVSKILCLYRLKILGLC
jgi:MoaA/NifB/PqqE/SkfB family radical SAM enzyme